MTSIDRPGSISRGHPRLLFLTLLLGFAPQGLTFTAIGSALPEMALDLGKSGEFIAQIVISVAALGLMVGGLVSGWILERVGTRVTLLTALFVIGAAGAAGLFTREPWLLVSTRFAVGFASAIMVTTCVWGIANEYDSEKRARTLGIASAVSSVTSFATTMIGGYLAQLGGWQLAFVQFPIFAVIGLLLAYPSIDQVKSTGEKATPGMAIELGSVIRLYLVSMVLYAIVFMGATQFPFVMQENGLRNPESRALVLGLITLSATVTGLFYGRLQRYLTAPGAFRFGLGCLAVGLLLIGVPVEPAYAFTSACASAILMGVNLGIMIPYLYQAVTQLSVPATRSRNIGLLGGFGHLGGFLNPLIFAPMSVAIGLHSVFVVAALIMAMLVVGSMRRGVLARDELAG